MKFSKGLCITIIIAMSLSLSGCQNAGKSQTPVVLTKENTLSFMLPSQPLEFDPTVSAETFAGTVIDHAFETLVTVDQEGNIQPAAAEKWEISPDGKTYTFTLRQNAKWTDGQPVTANQFKESWLRVMNSELKSNNASLITPYILNGNAYNKGEVPAESVGLKTEGDLKFIVELNAPTSFFLQLVTFWSFAPVRTDVISKAGEDWDFSPDTFVSNGPYQVIEIERGKSVMLKKNLNYWNKDQIAIEGIHLLYRQESDNPYELFKNGDLDGVYEVQVADLRSIPDLENELYIHQAMSTAYIFLNHQKPILQNEAFREALGTSIDRQKIVDEVLLGGGIASRYLVPSSMTMAGENFHEFTELSTAPDYKKAQSTMASVHLSASEKSKPIRVYYIEGRTDKPTMELITQKWHDLFGLTFELKGMPWETLYKTCLEGDYDIVLMGYGGDYPHPMTFIGSFLGNGFGSVISKWQDQAFQNEIYASLEIQDQKEALKAMRALESTIIDEYHIIPLYHRKLICLMGDRVTGWYRDGLLHFNFKNASLKP